MSGKKKHTEPSYEAKLTGIEVGASILADWMEDRIEEDPTTEDVDPDLLVGAIISGLQEPLRTPFVAFFENRALMSPRIQGKRHTCRVKRAVEEEEEEKQDGE